jgi:glycosyltransferase involved in cell wall biosynthesis
MKNINLLAPINSLGYGTVGINALLGLRQLGCNVALFPTNPNVEYPEEKAKELRAAVKAAELYDRWAPSIRICQQFDLAQHVGKGIHAAVTYFERDQLYDAEINHLQNQDIVFASSAWMRDLLEEQIRGPKIVVASPGVDTAIFHPNVQPLPQAHLPSSVPARQNFDSQIGFDSMYGMSKPPSPMPYASTPAPTVFLAVGKWEVRKGHDLLASLFQRAFTPRDNFKLILVTANPFLSPAQHNEWVKQFANLGDKVEIHSSRLPDQKSLARVMAGADCGVFLSRAEGWNLDAAEMLAMGKHILITNFSAHTEFATAENSWLVDIQEKEPCNDGFWFHGFGNWAKIGSTQQDQAISHLRAVHALKQAGRLHINGPGIETMKRFSWQAFSQKLLDSVSEG